MHEYCTLSTASPKQKKFIDKTLCEEGIHTKVI